MHWLWVEYTGTVRERASQLSCLVFISCYANRLLFLLFFLVDTLPDVVGSCVCVLLCCRLFHSSIVCCLSYIDILYHAYFRLWPNSCNGTKHSLFGMVWCVYVFFHHFVVHLHFLFAYPNWLFFPYVFFCWFTLHRAQCRVQIYKQTQTNIHIAGFFCKRSNISMCAKPFFWCRNFQTVNQLQGSWGNFPLN